MSAGDEMRRELLKLEAMTKQVFVDVATEAHRSIVEGSELTTAPGQPVDTGNLKASWQLTFPTPEKAEVTTNVEYAEAVEDGIGPHGARAYGAERSPDRIAKGGSAVGGSHSVKITVNGMPRIVAAAVARAAQGGGA